MAINTVAYGFLNLTDVFSQRVSTVGVDVVSDAVQQSVEEHNRQMNALQALFADPIDPLRPQARYLAPSVARLQPLDESGRARPIRPAAYYTVAFPIQAGGSAWGNTYVAGQKMTVQEANLMTVLMQEADMRWVRDHILAALFASAAWTFTDDEFGALSIQPLALASDGVKYFITSGADSAATDTHLVYQAAAIADAANPFPALLYSELLEHPENSGQVIALVPTNLLAAIQALTDYIPVNDPNVQQASTATSLSGDLGVAVPGIMRGYVDGVWIAEWRSLPDNFIIAVTTNGDRPLGAREDPEPSLRGFKQVAERPDYPWEERQYLRRIGFGARNRVGAVVLKVGSGSYAAPTGYESPMA